MNCIFAFCNDGRKGVFLRLVLIFAVICLFAFEIKASIEPNELLILVNQNSPTSRYVAKLYREYHSEVNENQILELSGLNDCSGFNSTAADEIITRLQYNQFIAEPVRNYLIAMDWVTKIKVIVTTAGMPYRIKDSDDNYSNAVYPAGSNPFTVSGNVSRIDAASVESELTCLWTSDYGDNPFGIKNRMVNVYHGYRSGFSEFERLEPGTKQFRWAQTKNVSGTPAKIEGSTDPVQVFVQYPFPHYENKTNYGAKDRQFNAGDIYLTCRLDGPKRQGESAIFAVRNMLERSAIASDPQRGVNPLKAAIVLDESPDDDYDKNRVYNLDGSVNYLYFQPGSNQPPDAIDILLKYDYQSTFETMTNVIASSGCVNIAPAINCHNIPVLLDRQDNFCLMQGDIDQLCEDDPNRTDEQAVIAYASFGTNGDVSPGSNYINCGNDGEAIFCVENGAVFTSIESFNAVTMFCDVNTACVTQGKIVDFISIGGAGAIGHAFEPMAEASVDNYYFFYNLLTDSDGDGRADLTFVEAAFSAIPFLSWSEVVIGDPLMRIAYGEGINYNWSPLDGDVNKNDIVDPFDIYYIKTRYRGMLTSANPYYFELYNDLCDLNKNYIIDPQDIYLAKINYRKTR